MVTLSNTAQLIKSLIVQRIRTRNNFLLRFQNLDWNVLVVFMICNKKRLLCLHR